MAIWDDILDERDRAMFGKAKMGETGGFGERPALVVVDMTYGFADSKYRLGCSEMGYPAVAATSSVLSIARRKNIPIFFTKGYSSEGGASIGRWKGGEPKLDVENEIVQDISPIEGEVVLEKRRPSAFFGTNLVDMLIFHQVDCVLIAGLTTSGCVRATAVDAFSYNYKVVIPEECVGDRSRISHKVSLLDIHMKYGDVKSLHEVTEWMTHVLRK